ncbi:hypothetical protein [Rhodoferax sp.]|uniref:hypothetical protein n=1 Tax=Rhodoferax sp. TaxID=50421 RepID=UPI002728C8BC|nr:hypothetical protein [Rhodoferax sp.]MDO8320124.1 hypothetical protein [Rhodoferax sp.]
MSPIDALMPHFSRRVWQTFTSGIGALARWLLIPFMVFTSSTKHPSSGRPASSQLFSTLQELADCFAIGTAKSVISTVRDAIKAWPDFAGQAGLSKTLWEAIQKQHLLL